MIGLDTRQGVYKNDAVLRDGAIELSNHDSVELRVDNDPIFDEGLLVGRVFCDEDGDGRLDPRERGIHGARVYIDSGSYAVSDTTGKWHLSQIDPGVHLVKIDRATLPAGSELTSPESEVITFTQTVGTRRHNTAKALVDIQGSDRVLYQDMTRNARFSKVQALEDEIMRSRWTPISGARPGSTRPRATPTTAASTATAPRSLRWSYPIRLTGSRRGS